MKFDFCIGNPPYQISCENTSDKPIYNNFMDAAYKIADVVETITPGRFLFNAGKTPKEWNKKMLSDEHVKVLHYEQDSATIFPTTDIKGGIAIILRDDRTKFIPIDVFLPYSEMQSIFNKIRHVDSIVGLLYPPTSYSFSDTFFKENDDVKVVQNSSTEYHTISTTILTTNVFNNLTDKFSEIQTEGTVGILGRYMGKREIRYIERKYISSPSNFDKYKIILPKSNGSGAIGEVLSTPLIGQPLIGHTQTFISIGAFDTENEAKNCLKYIKCKFTRAALGILKITQDNNISVWKYVPIQDFTDKSDIDWSKSISEIDRQLYKKYSLSEEEIKFIEEKVRSMEDCEDIPDVETDSIEDAESDE